MSERVILDVVRVLGNRPDLSEDAINRIACLLLDKHEDVRMAAGDALRSIGNLPASTISTILKHLGHRILSVRKAAADALKSTDSSALRGPITIAMVDWLRAFNYRNRLEALDALRGWPELPMPILDAVTDCLDRKALRLAAVYTLKGMSRQPNAHIAYEAVARRLGDANANIRWAAVYALKDMHDPPEYGSLTIRKCLTSMRADVRRATMESLNKRPHLPQSMVEGIIPCLGDSDVFVRSTAVDTLKGLEDLTNPTIRKIALLLEPNPIRNRNSRIRKIIRQLSDRSTRGKRMAALDVLRDRPNLNEDVVKTIAIYIGGEDVDLRWSAVYALKGRPDLPIDKLADWLSHEDVNIARAAADVLRGSPELSERALDRIPSYRPEDGGPETNASALDWFQRLKHIPHLPRPTIDRIIATGNGASDVREAAANLLKGRPNLSEPALRMIATWLGDHDQNVRWAVVDLLEGIPRLADATMEEIVQRVHSNDSKIQRTALYALAARPKLPSPVVGAIADCIGDEDEGLTTVALYALKGRRNLPEAVLIKFVQWLGGGNLNYRLFALDGLKGGPNLQSISGALTAIIDCLRFTEAPDKRSRLGGLQSFGKRRSTANEVRFRRAAADALRDQPEHLLSERVEEIRGWLTTDNDVNCRRAAVYALEGRPDLSDSTVDAIADCIHSNDALLRKAALDALRDRTRLPESTMKRIAIWLTPNTYIEQLRRWKDGGTFKRPELLEVRTAALQALQDRPNLCDPVLHAIAECLHDKDANIRWSAVYTLKGRPKLPESAIARCLDDKHVVDVRWAALNVLESNQNLSQYTISAVAGCLRNEDEDLERAALEILKRQPSLSDSAVKALLNFEGLDKQSALQLIRHDNVRRALQIIRKGPFLDALIQAARDYHLSWSADGDEYRMQTEEADHISYHR